MYGLLIVIGIILGLLISRHFLKERGYYESEYYWRTIFWLVVSGVIGARAYHVIDYLGYYSQNVHKIPALWEGGLGIYGALIACLLVLKMLNSPKLGRILDTLALVAPLVQAIGRLGNYFNQELYGKITNLPWGISISSNNLKYHPLFAYEAVLNVILFTTLLFLYKRDKYKQGKLVHLYLIGYAAIRFALEGFRINPWSVAGLNVAQFISILIAGVSYAIYTDIIKTEKPKNN